MTLRGSEEDRMQYVPPALSASSPSSFLSAQAMRDRAEAAARDRALRFAAYGVDASADHAATVHAETERQRKQWRMVRWLGWQRRRFSAWRRGA